MNPEANAGFEKEFRNVLKNAVLGGADFVLISEHNRHGRADEENSNPSLSVFAFFGNFGVLSEVARVRSCDTKSFGVQIMDLFRLADISRFGSDGFCCSSEQMVFGTTEKPIETRFHLKVFDSFAEKRRTIIVEIERISKGSK